jgi:flagellar motor switch/type III secretory pathway protein FliN
LRKRKLWPTRVEEEIEEKDMVAAPSPARIASDAGIGSGREPADARDSAEEERWHPVLGLACELTVELLLPDFTVSDFLKLRRTAVIDARWRLGRDIPLRLNGTLIGWVEFEVSGNHLAVRLPELV